jgi:hypothetical protein
MESMGRLNLNESTAMADLRMSFFRRVLTAGVVVVIALSAAQLARAQGDSTINTDNFLQPPVSQVTSQELDYMKLLADLFDRLNKEVAIAKPMITDKKVADTLETVTGFTKNSADLALALHTDWAAKQDVMAENSETRRVLTNIMMQQATDQTLRDLVTTKVISKDEAQIIGFFSFNDLREGVGSVAKHGLGNPEGLEQTLDWVASKAAGVSAFLYFSKTTFAATRNPQKSFSVGIAAAEVAAATVELAAQDERGATLSFFEQMQEKKTGLSLVDIWELAQRLGIKHGQPLQNIAQFYHGDASILGTVGANDVAAANARLRLAQQAQQAQQFRQPISDAVKPNSPLKTSDERPLGGIQLDQPLTGAVLRGVKIDAANGNVVLIGERDFLARGLNLRDFAMALWLVYGPQAQDPAFSLDPDDIRNPSGPWLRARYVPDTLQGRSFGADMFAADLLLKELSFQVKPNSAGKLEEWQSSVPGFRSYADLAMADSAKGSSQEQWARFWIVAEQVTSQQAGDTLLFKARMAIKARRQVPDPASPTGLRDIDTDPASLEARWARIATDHYEALAAESPALARVRDLAIAIGIAKSLKAAGAPVDLARVADLLNDDHGKAVAKISAFSISRQQRSQTPFREGNRQGVQIETRTLHLFGGVDLSVNPRVVRDDRAARSMREAVDTAFGSADPEAHIVRFVHDGSQLLALALPLLVKK